MLTITMHRKKQVRQRHYSGRALVNIHIVIYIISESESRQEYNVKLQRQLRDEGSVYMFNILIGGL